MSILRRGGKAEDLIVRYEDELKLFRTWQQKLGYLILAAVWLLSPLVITDKWLNILVFCGVMAIGAIGLNILTGFTGQVSLGHAFFIGCGAYTVAYFGVQQELTMTTWLPLAALVGALVGAVIGPFALRLRGQYLAIVTLGLLFLGEHIFDNWQSVTGGGVGTASGAPLDLGSLDFTDLELFGSSYTRDQGMFWFYWALVALGALLAKNLIRSRPGRALQAVRDRDLAAEVIGVSQFRYKVGAFALSAAYAAVAGALYGVYIQYVDPEQFGGVRGLFLSIQFIAMIILGGVGTVFGSVLGALVIGTIPFLIKDYSDMIPLVTWEIGNQPILDVPLLEQVLYGLLIIAFLLIEPRGLAAVWLRVKAYFKTWPFSY
jgi:branched-chain amino acid transport system permease protein